MTSMTVFAHVAMLGWIPLVLLIFALVPARRAILIAYIGGFLFLPNAAYDLSGMPDFTKTMASSFAALLGVILFHPKALLAYRLRWYDVPMVIFCCSPVMTSVLNDLGIYDGLSALLERLVGWGLPYLMGRLYFGSREGMYELVLGLFIGGLIYVPFCLWEVRMSPNLHYHIYGFRSRGFHLGVRYGSYRPSVFLWSFIPVANWLAVTTVAGFWLWWSGRSSRFSGVSTLIPVGILLITTLLSKTLGAVVLLLVGVSVLLSRSFVRRPSLLKLLVLIVPFIIGARATGMWSGEELVSLARMAGEERSHSLEYRLGNENILAEKALQRPIFGWGGYGRSGIYNEWGDGVSTTDGLWIIELGKSGLVGVASLLAIYMVPLLRFDRRYLRRSWLDPDIAPGAAAAAIIVMALVNNVPNVTINPLVQIAMGGVVAFSTDELGRRRKRKPRSPTGANQSLAKALSGRRPQLDIAPDR